MSDSRSDNAYVAPRAEEIQAAGTMADRGHGEAPAPPDGTPATASNAAPRTPFRPFAIIVGMIIDLGLTFIVSEVQVALATARFTSLDELSSYWLGTEHRLEFLPFGALCSIAGGYVTGALARGREGLHAFGNVCMSFLYFGWLWWTDSVLPFDPPWLSILEHLTIVLAIFGGAGLARRRRVRRSQGGG